MGIPMFIPYMALTLSFGIITLVQGVTLIGMLKDFNVSPAEEKEAGS